jgi:UDP-N-acetylglucosamine 2-epimerase (non-hydrolysing)
MKIRPTPEKTFFLNPIMYKILLIFGTRPELIKIVPLIREFEKRSLRESLILVHTNQHNSLVEKDLKTFNIKPDYQLKFSHEGNNLINLVGKLLLKLDTLCSELKSTGTMINSIISQGDTATTYCSSLLAFHASIPFYHIEAGLRTLNFTDPFPEEFYRKSISSIAAFHFVPTVIEYQNLINEQVDATKILITGNTVIDNLKNYYTKSEYHPKKQALITLHRREKGDLKRHDYIEYFKKLAMENKDWQFLWLKHPSAKLVDNKIEEIQNIVFMEPVSYFEMLRLYEETSIIYTDSGGIQEEAGYLGIPCIIARSETERKQGIDKGLSCYLDFNEFNIKHQLDKFDRNELTFKNDIYGNGDSAELIMNELIKLNKQMPIE